MSEIAIIGSGRYSAELARVLICENYRVSVYDIFKDGLDMTAARIEWAFKDNIKVLENITFVQNTDELKNANIVLQVGDAGEDRFGLFKTITALVSDNSMISPLCYGGELTDFAFEMKAPERFVSFRFFGEVTEITKTRFTGENILKDADSFIKNIGKTPVFVKDIAGGIVARIRAVFISSAMKIMEKSKIFPFEIDNAAKELGGFPKGPFETADELGLEENLKLSDFIYEKLGSPERLKSPDAAGRLLQYGCAGKKTGLGFYIYDDGKIAGQNPVLKQIVTYLGISKTGKHKIFASLLKFILQEAELLSCELEVSPSAIDNVLELALGWESGPFELAKEYADLLKSENKKNDWGDAL